MWGKGNRTYIEKELVIDTRPPLIEILTKAHNINPGGAALVAYKVSEPCRESGVVAGENFFPGFPGGFKDPDVMLAGANLGDDAFADWARWPNLAANRFGNQFLLPDETIGRPSPRLTMAGRSVCIALDRARRNREAARL